MQGGANVACETLGETKTETLSRRCLCLCHHFAYATTLPLPPLCSAAAADAMQHAIQLLKERQGASTRHEETFFFLWELRHLCMTVRPSFFLFFHINCNHSYVPRPQLNARVLVKVHGEHQEQLKAQQELAGQG